MNEQLTPCEERMVLHCARRQFSIGIPLEQNPEEPRLPLTPQGVEVLVAQGIVVLVERGAGVAARFSDEQYASAGASMLSDHSAVYAADIVVSVAPPSLADVALLREGQSLACFIGRHVCDAQVFAALSQKRVTLVALDYLTDSGTRESVISRCLGEIEGMMAVTVAARLLELSEFGKGVIIGGVTGVPPSEMLILGSGMAACCAARCAQSLGSNVKIFDTDHARLQRLARRMPFHVFTSVLHPQALAKALRSADVVIGTRHNCFFADEALGRVGYCIPRENMSSLKRGAVMVDLDIVNGGRAETSHPTTLANPTFYESNIIHHCLPDITVLVAHSASIVISDVVSPLLSLLAQVGSVDVAARDSNDLQNAIAIYQGATTNKHLAQKMGSEAYDIRLLLI